MYRMTVENEWGVDITEHTSMDDALTCFNRAVARGDADDVTRLEIEKV